MRTRILAAFLALAPLIAAAQTTIITDLPNAAALTGVEWFPADQGTCSTCTVRVSPAQLDAFFLATPQTWVSLQKFTLGDFALLGSSTGFTLVESANTGTSNFTATLPANTGVLAELNLGQTWSGPQEFANSDFILCGSSTGCTTFTSANSSASSFTLTVPAITDVLVTETATQTLTGKTISGASNTLTNIPAAQLTGTASVSTSGNAATANALAATPSQCTSGQFATGVAASGNANCSTPSGGVSSVAAGGGIAVSGTGSGPVTGAVTISENAPNRTVTSSPTVLSTDTGGQINSNVSGGGTLTIPAISSTVLPANSTLTVVNYSASTLAVSSTPTVNSGGGCITGTGIPPGDAWNIISNGTTLDCNQTISSSSGSPAFSAVTPGTNTGTLVVGSGGSLSATGSGTIAATSVTFNGVATGTNTNTLTVGTGGSVTTSGTGIVNANEVNGATVPASVPLCSNSTSQPVACSITINAQTGTTYTVATTDNRSLVTLNNSAGVAVTLPQATGSFEIGRAHV